MGEATQDDRMLGLETDLGKDVLLIEQVSGQEGLSQLFRYRVQAVSEDDAINFDDLMGTPATVRIEISESGPTKTRYINGIVSQVTSVGHDRKGLARYELILVPWLWLLTRTSDCRIFQNKTVMEIIKEIFSDHSLSDYEDKATGSYEAREYCVQYGETAFNFVQRLMEHEGIYYFFKHEDGVHKLVFCDDMGTHEPVPGFEKLIHRPKLDPTEEKPAVHAWQACGLVTPGTFVLNSFDFEAPVPSSTSRLIGKSAKAHQHKWGEGEIYENSSDYVDRGLGETWAKVRREEVQMNARTITGETAAPGVMVGMTFELTESPRDDQNAEYLVTGTSFETHAESYSSGAGDSGAHYSCSFTGIPKGRVYRPPRTAPVPRISGPQTALVVGPDGEEIYTDEYGRVKVQFIWDRYGESDAGSSCWIRVSTPWSGKQWGGVSIPRIGQEVVVEFLDGDPDRPLITGRVYNKDQMPPYGLPGGKVISGMKTNSTPGGGGYNEMCMDDTQGKELIRIHGQYDMDTTIEHDLREHVLNDRSRDVTNNETIKIGGTQDVKVIGAVTEDYDDKQSTTVNKEIVIISETQFIHGTAATEIQLQTGASKILMKCDGSIEISGTNIAISGSESVAIKGMSVTSEAKMDHNTKGSIVVSSGMASNTVKGGVVMLNP